MPAVLHERTEDLLRELPPFLANSSHFSGTLDVLVREVVRLDASAAEVRDTAFPALASAYLEIWELMLGLPPNPEGMTVEARRNAVQALLRALRDSQRSGWEAAVTKLIGTNWTYAVHSPDPYVITVTIPFADTVAEATVLRALLRAVTPAPLDIAIDFSEGFIVGESLLSEDTL